MLGSPRKGRTFKIWLNIQRVIAHYFGDIEVISRNFTRRHAARHALHDNVRINFGRGAPNNIWEDLKRPKFVAISDNFRLRARIPPEWIDNENLTSALSNIVLYWMKNSVNFGPLTKSYRR